MIPESVIKAVRYLDMGKPVIIRDRDDREGEGDLAFSARYCTIAMVNTALTIARGLLCVSLPPEYAKKFNIKRLESNNKDTYDTPFGIPVSLSDGSSGISAQDRNETIRRLADINSTPEMWLLAVSCG